MKTVINIALPRGFLGGRSAVATTATRDDQKRDPDGKFGSGGGSSSGGGKKTEAKKKAPAHAGPGGKVFSKEEHGEAAKHHYAEASKHRLAAMKSSGEIKARHEKASSMHGSAAVSHSGLERNGLGEHAETAHHLSKMAKSLSKKVGVR